MTGSDGAARSSSLGRIEPARVAAILVGVAVPSLVLGKAAIAIAVVLLVAIMAVTELREALIFKGAQILRSPFGLGVVTVLALWIPGVFASIDPLLSVDAWARTAVVVALAAAVFAVLDARVGAADTLAKALIFGVMASVLVCFASVWGRSEILSLLRFQGWLPRDAALSLKSFGDAGMLLIPAVAWAGWRLGGWWRVAAAIAGIGLVVIIQTVHAATAIAGLIAVLLYVLSCAVLRNRPPAAWLAAAAVGLAVVVGMFVVYAAGSTPRTVAGFEPPFPTWLVDIHRQIIWEFAWQRALEEPWLGYGLNAINQVVGAASEVPGLNATAQYLPSHPHNWFIELFAEAGLVGLVPFLVLVVSWLTWLTRAWFRERDAASLAAGAVSVGYFTSGLFNFSFWASWWQLSHLILVAALLSTRAVRPAASRPRPLKAVLKSEAVRRLLCWVVAQYLRLVYASGRWELVGADAPQRCWDAGQAMIGCFWHGRILMMPYAWRWPGPFHMMISAHRDGRMIADTVAHLGFHAVAGSSSRGGSGALRELLMALKSGATVGITPDGPRGPRMRAQAGVVKLAQLSGAPVFPVSFGAVRRRTLSSWDRFTLVWPFNRGLLIYGEPITVPRDAGPEEQERIRLLIEERLNAITAECDRRTGHEPILPAAPGGPAR